MRTEVENKEATSAWWKTLDMNDPYICKIFSGMFGSTEQRIEQLYIVRDNLKFAQKPQK